MAATSKNEKLKQLYSRITGKTSKNRRQVDSLTQQELDLIYDSPSWGYRFCRSVFKEPREEVEKVIINSKSSRYAYSYTRFVLKSRGSKPLEKVIALNPKSSLNYARFVLGGRFKLGEPSLLRKANLKSMYSDFLIQNAESLTSRGE